MAMGLYLTLNVPAALYNPPPGPPKTQVTDYRAVGGFTVPNKLATPPPGGGLVTAERAVGNICCPVWLRMPPPVLAPKFTAKRAVTNGMPSLPMPPPSGNRIIAGGRRGVIRSRSQVENAAAVCR